MRLTDHVTLNFNNSLSTTAVFLGMEKAFDTAWHPGLLRKLSELYFSSSFIKHISSFPSNKKIEYGWGENVHASRYTSLDAARFSSGSYPVQSVYKLHSTNPRGLSSPLCQWYMFVYDRSQRGLCSQEAAARAHLKGIVVWALEHKDQWG
jgi:hypothetical protein